MKLLLNKILLSLSIFFGVYTLLFFLFNILSVDSALTMMGQNGDEETIKAIKMKYHLDVPKSTQFVFHLNNLSPVSVYNDKAEDLFGYKQNEYGGNKMISIPLTSKGLYVKYPYLGRSYQSYEKVSHQIFDRFKITIILALGAMLIASIIGVMIGMICSTFPRSALDYTLTSLSNLGIALPSFFVAIILSICFGYLWSEWTGLELRSHPIQYTDAGERYFSFKNLILPIAALSMRPIAILALITKNSMLEVLSEDYIRTARAKGLSEIVVFFKHALLNSLNPIITSVSSWLGSLLAGTFFIEIVFDIKGLGALTVDALLKFDIPIVMGASLFIALIFIVISFSVDYLYKIADPRVELS